MADIQNIFTKLKNKWGIKSNWDFIAINIVFSLAGMAIVIVRKPLFLLLGFSAETPFWMKFLAWLAIVFPTYQINLLIFGFLLGQFGFFWDKEKKLFQFFAKKIFPTS